MLFLLLLDLHFAPQGSVCFTTTAILISDYFCLFSVSIWFYLYIEITYITSQAKYFSFYLYFFHLHHHLLGQSSADCLKNLQENKNELKVSLGIAKIRSLLSFFVFRGQACVHLLLFAPSTIYCTAKCQCWQLSLLKKKKKRKTSMVPGSIKLGDQRILRPNYSHKRILKSGNEL